MRVGASNNLGRDRIAPLLWRLALPAIFAQVVNALYNIVDRIYIGHIAEAGALALTGLGVSFPILIILAAFGSLIGAGGPPLAAIAMGARHEERAEHYLGNALSFTVIFSVIMTVVMLLAAEPLLRVFGASDETMPYAQQYLDIYLLGTIFSMLGIGLGGFIATQGFAKTAMMTSVIGAVVNIVLDPIFIFWIGWGVRGAAVATVIAQAASAAWILYFFLSKQTQLSIRKKYLPLDIRVLRPMIALGFSPFVMLCGDVAIMAVINSSLLKYGGYLAVGAMTITISISGVGFMPLFGVTQGAQPIISYNYGARKTTRVRHCFRLLLKTSIIWATGLWLVMLLFPKVFIGIFTSDPQLTELTAKTMRVALAMIFLMGIQFSCQQTFVALGQAKRSLWLSVTRKIFLLIPLALLLPLLFSDNEGKMFGVLLALPISDLLAVAITAGVFAWSFKRLLLKRLRGF